MIKFNTPNIVFNTFNLLQIEKQVVQQAFDDLHDRFSFETIAEQLGVSVRTLYRMVNDYDIKYKRKDNKSMKPNPKSLRSRRYRMSMKKTINKNIAA